ncbi:hypothetical protein OQJ19_03775 [Fluoribacter gormanii]|uniref:Lipoprotein n=1 Tax=Fluoribacter gormanii TaxID=464 RepID=A0A377GH73_9GAMM|nr:hypothetical protein [Fluoribacter gormanii]KTD03727.1 hypothetical protein Lgor_1143 [Fluoribacter gormanii]MCW8444585.1 hypothetical protein [Fluoribacter gormanii]MCW8469776.1 hypothetical protein [Fluoribacter gormanii]SIR82620.1 hypothetical protein SAMN05421777_12732 [Fluoribacter gormanii]STO23903.1 Uncharacterised protein [Fluoribacter gormanii]
MKWIILLGSIVLMAGCCCTTAYTPVYTPAISYTSAVTYKPVVRYRPVVSYRPVAVTRVVTPAVAPVVEPVSVYSYPVGPLDVTTTTIDFY